MKHTMSSHQMTLRPVVPLEIQVATTLYSFGACREYG